MLYYDPSVFNDKKTVLEQLSWIRKYLADNYKKIEEEQISGNIYTETVDLNGSDWSTEYLDLPTDKFLKRPFQGDTFDILITDFMTPAGQAMVYGIVRYNVMKVDDDFVYVAPQSLIFTVKREPVNFIGFVSMGSGYDYTMINIKTIPSSYYSGHPVVGQLVLVPISNYSNPIFTEEYAFGYVYGTIANISANGDLTINYMSYVGGVKK